MPASNREVSVSHPEKGRHHHLDNLRTSLTALVILHHASIPYGGLGSWTYASPHHPYASSPCIIVFEAVNQTFFMGSFFYLSGLMTPSSLRKRGRKAFLKNKAWKLGVPAIIYTVAGAPLIMVLRFILQGRRMSSEDFVGYWRSIRGAHGPMWYTATLLTFDTLYAFLLPWMSDFSSWNAASIMVLNVTTTFLLRIRYPAGRSWAPLNLQLGYAPQYLIAYLLGTTSKPPTATSVPLVSRSQKKVLAATSILSGAFMLGLLRSPSKDCTLATLNGGWNTAALSYVVWNESTGFLLGSTLLDIFRGSRWTRRKWGSVGRYSYASFLVHPIVLTGVQLALDGWKAGAIFKIMVVGGISIVASWSLGWTVCKIPGVKGTLL